ncbi:DUF2018 domain-containing protein [Helicobacter cholecystus]|uniref:DUF2018 domain-containing protein n=1 Tax=Helicobacter cholecystus TaxID=45498 RepID=A0A3D8IY82_9HELI|nr:DUF2018 family protein [Helicobacter cholecystus]RDU69511.1 DUF2018 domain-containing protein [Helicobacter cholecystus]VEJ24064.1 Domain of uncharacterised function (DUF2018) [Helicobacter cholecystus]
MFDELFEGSPIAKWKEIILHASPSCVEEELERLLEELAVYELQQEGEEINAQSINRKKCDLAITSMSKILSKNE